MDAPLTAWVKYSRTTAGGDMWSDRGTTTHAVEHGRTLCGVYVKSIQQGWEIDNYGRWDPTGVTCKRCTSALAKRGISTAEPEDRRSYFR
jgi:hypothetical protein